MIVTLLYCVNAAQELRDHAVPDRPQPRTRGRMVEHAHFARRPARNDALRSVPEKSWHRPEHAHATAQCAGRGRAPQPPPLQRKAAARRVSVDGARTRFPPGAARAAGLRQPPLRARGRERAAGRPRDRRRRGSDPGGPGHGAADQYARLCAHRRSRRRRAHAAKVCRAKTPGGRTQTHADEPQTPRAREDGNMSVATLDATVEVGAREAAAVVAPAELSPRTRVLLRGPIVPTLLRMAWPNVLVMVAQAATGLIETWFVSKLGTDALAGMALVFPGVMLMQMISAGAMGGGISSAIARSAAAGAIKPMRWRCTLSSSTLRSALCSAPSCSASADRSIARSAARAANSTPLSPIRTSCLPAACCSGCSTAWRASSAAPAICSSLHR